MSSTQFDQLLSFVTEERLRPSTQGSRGILIASESDKGRVINSASFRRLQQKAQVFPLEPNAAVRTRLTHSIEVSQIGRHLAQKIIEKFSSNSGNYDKLAAFVNTIETACLLHDIGNPPFGHLGESAVKQWFADENNNSQIPDLIEFDGNPQGFRLITFLAGADDSGLNLTSTLLLSTVKYPWGIANKSEGKKIGLFDADIKNYEEACAHLNWKPGKKFPFLQLMDVADEIAYSMSDLEDGLEKEIIRLEDLKDEFTEFEFKESVLKAFVAFKINVINRAVTEAADSFTSHLDSILNGNNVCLLYTSRCV